MDVSDVVAVFTIIFVMVLLAILITVQATRDGKEGYYE
jgi:hypothetical protein